MWLSKANSVLRGMNGMRQSVMRTKPIVSATSFRIPHMPSLVIVRRPNITNCNSSLTAKNCEIPDYVFKHIDSTGIGGRTLHRTFRCFTSSTHHRHLDDRSLGAGSNSRLYGQPVPDESKRLDELVTHKESLTSGERCALDTLPQDLSQYDKKELFATLKNMSLDQLLTLVARSHSSLDSLSLALCVKNVYRNYLESAEEERQGLAEQLRKEVAFQILVASVCAKAPHYDPQILYDLVKFLHNFGYTSQDFPLRVVLQLMRFGVGDLTLDQLICLSSFVQTMTHTKETFLLLEGVKCLINGRRDKIESLTLAEKVLALELFTEILDEDFTVGLLSSLLENLEDFEAIHAAMVMSALGRLPYRCLYKKDMLLECVGIIDEQFEDLTSDEVIEVVESMEIFKQKIPDDYHHILLRVAEKLKSEDDVELNEKLDIIDKLWTESLSEVELVKSVIKGINDKQTYGDKRGINSELLTSLLQNVVESPIESGVLEELDTSVFIEWLKTYRDSLTNKGVECVKQLMAVTDQTVPQWVAEEEHRLGSTQVWPVVTKLDKTRTVYMDGLSLQADEKDILEFFRGHSKVTGVEMLSGAAFVEFEKLDSTVYKLSNEMLLDSVVQLKPLEEVQDLPEPFEYMFVTEEDYKEKPRSDWPTVRSLVQRLVSAVKERALVAGYNSHTDTPVRKQCMGKSICTELVLTGDNQMDHNIAVVVVRPGQYFHNTGQLKREYCMHIKDLQTNGYKILVVYVKDISSFNRDELYEWVDERLHCIEHYQDPHTWTGSRKEIETLNTT